jgi:hypothetical protein
MSKSKSEIEIIELSKKHAAHFVKKRRLVSPSNRKCKVPECERPVNPSEARRGRYICGFHREQRQIKKRPVFKALRTLRVNGVQRNRGVEVSKRHWYYLNYFTLYWKKKGRQNHSLQIDRIDNSKGYSDDNIQVVDKLYNIQKGQGKD